MRFSRRAGGLHAFWRAKPSGFREIEPDETIVGCGGRGARSIVRAA